MKRCTFGFDCSAMFLTPGLTASDCPNQSTCKTLPDLPLDSQTWFSRDQIRQRIALTTKEAARLMLCRVTYRGFESLPLRFNNA